MLGTVLRVLQIVSFNPHVKIFATCYYYPHFLEQKSNPARQQLELRLPVLRDSTDPKAFDFIWNRKQNQTTPYFKKPLIGNQTAHSQALGSDKISRQHNQKALFSPQCLKCIKSQHTQMVINCAREHFSTIFIQKHNGCCVPVFRIRAHILQGPALLKRGTGREFSVEWWRLEH